MTAQIPPEYINYVISNTDLESYESNSLTDFSNTVPHAFLDKRFSWRIAVESVTFHSNFENIPPPLNLDTGSIIILKLKNEQEQDTADNVRGDISMQSILEPESESESEDFQDAMDVNFANEKNHFRSRRTAEDNDNDFINYSEEFIALNVEKKAHFNLAAKVYDHKSLASELSFINQQIYGEYKTTIYSTEFFLNFKNYDVNSRVILLFEKQFSEQMGQRFINKATRRALFSNAEFYEFDLDKYEKEFVKVKFPTDFFTIKSPKMINIQSTSVYPTLMGEKSGQTVLAYAYEKNKKYKSFSFRPKKLEFYPLISQDLRNVNFKITDENLNYLSLLPGVATIIKSRISSMNKDEFFVRVNSEKSDNNSEFNVVLGKRLNFPDREWKVALHSMISPNKYQSLPGADEKRSIKIANVNTSIEMVVPEILNSTDKFIELLNEFAKKLSVKFTLNDGDILSIHNTGPAVVTLTIAQNLLTVMGSTDFDEQDSKSFYIRENISFDFTNPVNLNALLPNYIFIYCNIIQPTLTGGRYAPVLKMITIPSSENEFESILFENLEYIPIEFQDISEIKFELRTHSGQKVHFANHSDPVSLNLLFTKNTHI